MCELEPYFAWVQCRAKECFLGSGELLKGFLVTVGANKPMLESDYSDWCTWWTEVDKCLGEERQMKPEAIAVDQMKDHRVPSQEGGCTGSMFKLITISRPWRLVSCGF